MGLRKLEDVWELWELEGLSDHKKKLPELGEM